MTVYKQLEEAVLELHAMGYNVKTQAVAILETEERATLDRELDEMYSPHIRPPQPPNGDIVIAFTNAGIELHIKDMGNLINSPTRSSAVVAGRKALTDLNNYIALEASMIDQRFRIKAYRERNSSVVNEWVNKLPYMMQAMMLTALRGPDGMPKDTIVKNILMYLRGTLLKPADDGLDNNSDTFMWMDHTKGYMDNDSVDFNTYAKWLWEDHDAYPHHFLMHLIHCAEIIGYKHPNGQIRAYWFKFYTDACDVMHMHPESHDQLNRRLNK